MDDQTTNATNFAGRRDLPRISMMGAWTRYLTTIAATVAALFVVYGVVLAVLNRADALPPPAIVNELCSDEKLRWLRDNPPADPTLLVVGSSIAWRNVSSAAFVRRRPTERPLNGGFCHTQMHQAAFVTEYLLRHFPSIRSVVAVVVPQDFTDCTLTPRELFDPATADAYVFERRWPYRFYVTQFDPVALARNALHIRAMRDGRNPLETMEINSYGDGPLRTAGFRGLIYADIEGYDRACFAALRNLATTVTASGRRLFVATGPVHPDWSARYDPSGQLRAGLRSGIEASLQGIGGARFWDGATEFAAKPSDFTDAVHINATAAGRFSALLAATLNDRDAAGYAQRAARR